VLYFDVKYINKLAVFITFSTLNVHKNKLIPNCRRSIAKVMSIRGSRVIMQIPYKADHIVDIQPFSFEYRFLNTFSVLGCRLLLSHSIFLCKVFNI